MDPSTIPPPPPLNLEEGDGQIQEFKDLLASLPREKGWMETDLCQYQGFWYLIKHLQAILACQKQFQAHTTDLLLVTSPKTGTTWMKALIFAIVNRVNYRHADHPLLTNNPHGLVPYLELQLYLDNNIPDFTDLAPPRLFSTHLPYTSLPESIKDSKCKIVYLCRNPRDTLISLWHFANKLRPNTIGPISLEDAFEMFCRGVSPFGPFWDHVLGYWKESLEKPQEIFFLTYEDLRGEPTFHVRRLAEFLGYPFSPEEEKEGVVDGILKLCSFENLSNLEVNTTGKSRGGMPNSLLFRRGEVGDWMNYFTQEMIECLDCLTQEKLHGSGLKF